MTKPSKLMLVLSLCAAPAFAQIDVRIGVPGPPPDEYIATTYPTYYEGRPVYYYNGYWRYRDHDGRWRYYEREPEFLASRRQAHAPPRRYYESNRWEGRREGWRDDRRHEERREHEEHEHRH